MTSNEYKDIVKPSHLWGKQADKFVPRLIDILKAQGMTEEEIKKQIENDLIGHLPLAVIKKLLARKYPKMYCIQCGNVWSKSLYCPDCEKKNIEKKTYKKSWGIN